MTRRTKAQLEAEIADLQARAIPQGKPIGVVVLQILADMAVILVALAFLVMMWLNHGAWLP